MRFKPHGVVPALVTPLDAAGELIEHALRDLLDYTISNGVHGVFLLGSAGEFYGLRTSQRTRILDIGVEHVDGRVPIYAGASDMTTRDAIDSVQMVGSVGGISALSVLTPFFLTPSQSELEQHFRAIAAATELPVVLYNNPGRTQVPIAAETLAALAGLDNVVGIKDSSGDIEVTEQYLQAVPPDFSVLIGKDTLIYEGLRRGAAGAIASTANVAPLLVAELFRAFEEGETSRAARLQERLSRLRAAVDAATFPVALKVGLKHVGIDAGQCFAPAGQIDEASLARLVEAVEDAVNVGPTA